MRVLGIDQSLASTGVAVADGGAFTVLDVIKPAMKGHERVELIVSRCVELAVEVDAVVVESPTFGVRRSASTGALFGLFGVLVHDLWRAGREPILVSPSQRAMYAAGSGGANKDQVLAAAIRRYDDERLVDNNTVDAAVLAAMVARLLGDPLKAEGDLPDHYLGVLSKLTLPGNLEQHVPEQMVEDRAWLSVSKRVDARTLQALKQMEAANPAYAHALIDFATERGFHVYPNQGYRTCVRRLEMPTHQCGAKKCSTEWRAPESWTHSVLLRSDDGTRWAILSQEQTDFGIPAPLGRGLRAHLHTTVPEPMEVF